MQETTDTRRRIVEAARDLIYSRSYSDVGVQAICAEAGVKKGSFYHFFPSKRDLTLAVVDELLVLFRQRLEQAFVQEVPPMERLDHFVRSTYELQRALKLEGGAMLGCPFGNLALEMSTQDEVIRCRLDRVFSELQGYFERALAEALDRGDLATLDVEATAEAMFAYMEGVMLMAKTRNDPDLILKLGPAVRAIRVGVRDS